MKKSSISLAEMASVFAIVAVAAAVAVPVLSRADDNLDKANLESCISNVKQLGLGVLQYSQDFDEHFPSGANYYGTGSGWAEQIWPYVRSTAIFKCPSDSNPKDVASYGYNSNLVRLTGYIPSAPTGQTLAVSDSPAQTVLLFEVENNGVGAAPAYSVSPYGKTSYVNGAQPWGITDTTDIHFTGKRNAPIDGWSPAGRGTGAYQGELSGMGSNPPAGSAPLLYATGPMSGSTDGSPYVSHGPRHGFDSVFCFLDGHVKTMQPREISAGKNNSDGRSSGGNGLAANTARVDDVKFGGTFSLM